MSARTDVEIFDEFQRLALTQVGFPTDFQALFFVGNTARFITQHMLTTAFNVGFETVPKTRDGIITAFSRIEFLVDELIKIYMIGINSPKETEFYSLYDKMGIGAKIKLLKEWNVIEGTLFSALQNLIAVRNKVAHDITLHNAMYNDVRIFSDRDHTEWNNFRIDLNNAWGNLREIYRVFQHNEDWNLLISQIETYQEAQSGTNADQS